MKFTENITTEFKDKLIDFSNCKYGGKDYGSSAMPKTSIIYNNEKYLLKYMEKNIAKHYNYNKDNDETYFNSIYSEFISCHIGKMIGLNIQDTFIGYEKILNEKNNEIEYIPCVACKDFCKDKEILLNFKTVIQMTNRTEPYSKSITNFYDILEIIDKQSLINKQQLKEWFLDMFIFDSFIGNFDRNLKNFGIIEESNGTYRIAPIFDCASSLHPKASKEKIDQINNSFKELKSSEIIAEQAFNKPTSYFTYAPKKKINYYNFLITEAFDGDLDIAKAICRIAPKIINIVNNDKLRTLLDDMIGIIPDDRHNVIHTELLHKVNYMMSPMLNIANNIIDLNWWNDKLNEQLDDYKYMTKSNDVLISNINTIIDDYYIIDGIKSILPLNIQEKYNYLTQDYIFSTIDQFIQNLLTEKSAMAIKNSLIENKVYPEYIKHFDSIIDDPQYYKK